MLPYGRIPVFFLDNFIKKLMKFPWKKNPKNVSNLTKYNKFSKVSERNAGKKIMFKKSRY